MPLYTNTHRQKTNYRNEITYKSKFVTPEQYKETRLLVFCLTAAGCKTKGRDSILLFVPSRGKPQNTTWAKLRIDTNSLYCGSSSLEKDLSTQRPIFLQKQGLSFLQRLRDYLLLSLQHALRIESACKLHFEKGRCHFYYLLLCPGTEVEKYL